jgi:hypothetical protein
MFHFLRDETKKSFISQSNKIFCFHIIDKKLKKVFKIFKLRIFDFKIKFLWYRQVLIII